MIEIKQLYCAYDGVNVLNSINLSINKGRITAILGPNGSGKSTLIKSILGIVVPHSGDILVDGSSVLGHWKYKGSIDYLPQIARFPENLEFNELLSMMSDLRNGQTRASELIDMFNMQMHLNKKMGHFSGGMKQKANIILSMMFDSFFLILDEPSSGLDPLALLNFKSFINREKKAGKTVILSTHILNLVEDLSDDVIYMLDGKIYFHGSLQEIMKEYGEKNLEKTIAKILMNQLNVEGSQI